MAYDLSVIGFCLPFLVGLYLAGWWADRRPRPSRAAPERPPFRIIRDEPHIYDWEKEGHR